MAQRRMFSRSVVTTDTFLDMGSSARALYYQLGIEADDDGFVSSPRAVMRSSGSSTDDLNILLARGFILKFTSGVIVITDWRTNNYIQNDRYTPTQYGNELAGLVQDENGRYFPLADSNVITAVVARGVLLYPLFTTDGNGKRQAVHLNKKQRDKWPKSLSEQQLADLDTTCIQAVSSLEAQVSIGKDRLVKSQSRTTTTTEPTAQKNTSSVVVNEEKSDIPKQSSPFHSVTEFWQKQGFGALAPLTSDKLRGWWNDFQEIGSSPEDAAAVLIKGMEFAIDAGNTNYGYLNGILHNWEAKGLTTVQAVEANEAKRAASPAKSQQGATGNTWRPYRDSDYWD